MMIKQPNWGDTMPYNTILVHVDDSAHAPARIALAVALALREGSHLIGAAMTGVSRQLYQGVPPEQDDPTLALHLDMLRASARSALAGFSAQCQAAGLHAAEARLVDDEAGDGLSLQGRTADLVVISQADPDGKAAAAAMPAQVITGTGRPVLVLPLALAPAGCGRRIVVAWDASREAARAVQIALPMLQQADSVELAVFDSGGNGQMLADALSADPLPYLERHGVQASLVVHAVEKRRGPHRRHEVGDALLARAQALDADLLVMGAYGHSPLRESVLGGVTRTMLEAMTLPVLMVH